MLFLSFVKYEKNEITSAIRSEDQQAIYQTMSGPKQTALENHLPSEVNFCGPVRFIQHVSGSMFVSRRRVHGAENNLTISDSCIYGNKRDTK